MLAYYGRAVFSSKYQLQICGLKKFLAINSQLSVLELRTTNPPPRALQPLSYHFALFEIIQVHKTLTIIPYVFLILETVIL